ncbi:MAG: uL30 family ribosomal protein, partial [Candidatus Hadarchaeota archaeon]|nr:uL30 family ribosomal protein [Candidatus Hadarchaeota archaeon]
MDPTLNRYLSGRLVRKVNRLAVVRIRGSVNVSRDVEETLWMLGLARVNHCVVVHDSSSYKGMLQKVKDFVTW